jgi:hypothetical protein
MQGAKLKQFPKAIGRKTYFNVEVKPAKISQLARIQRDSELKQ